MGHQQAGKSLTVDLLADRQLLAAADEELGTNIIFEIDNPDRHYQPIHFVSNPPIMIMEGFTLDSLETSFDMMCKTIFLAEALKQVKGLSLVVAVEEPQKE